MGNGVTESDRLTGSDENVCILHTISKPVNGLEYHRSSFLTYQNSSGLSGGCEHEWANTWACSDKNICNSTYPTLVVRFGIVSSKGSGNILHYLKTRLFSPDLEWLGRSWSRPKVWSLKGLAQYKKKVENGWKKVVQPAFGCAQHPKAGRNTQQLVTKKSGILMFSVFRPVIRSCL